MDDEKETQIDETEAEDTHEEEKVTPFVDLSVEERQKIIDADNAQNPPTPRVIIDEAKQI